ncbi:MAG TPA: hypothetical protein VHZ07_19705 [Bryobacteraceae bacterium]|jgi:hypothetical protein|nr:hypothetical protein [Bryobacteraceae bacterium]
MYRRAIAIVCSALILAGLGAAARKNGNDTIFSQINAIVKTLSAITGLPEKHPVTYAEISKKQLRQFLVKRIKKTLKPAELHADELSLKMFGLVPQDFDLKQSTIDLLTEQAAAFYDYQERKLFLLQGSSFTAEQTTLAHELSHALADQNFNLSKYMDSSPGNDDENLAHTAVVEGEASWLMVAYDLKASGQPPVPTREMLDSVADSSDSSMAEYPVLKSSPLYIQQSLLFPYSEGTLFFDAVYRKLGKPSFAGVFTDPPSDSAQIIHPERYFDREKETKPDVVMLKLRDAKLLTEGSMGEFDQEMMIREFLNKAEADRLAPHLSGGYYKIFEIGKNREPLLDYASEWDSERDAAAYFAAYRQILRKKWKTCNVAQSSPAQASQDVFAGTGDNGYFVSRLMGDRVTSVEGLHDLDEWNRLRFVPSSTAAAAHVEF